MKVLHVIDNLNLANTRQIMLLAPALAKAGCTFEICCLGAGGLQLEELRRAQIPFDVLGWTRWLDATAAWKLRTRLRGGHDIVHVWGLAALRAAAVLAPQLLPRVVVSSPLSRSGKFSWWERRLLRRVGCVALAGESQRQECARQRLGDVRWRIIAAMVSTTEPAVPGCLGTGDPRRVACVGALERGGGFREAVWAADILRYVFADFHVVMFGPGPGRTDVEAMVSRLDIGNVHLIEEKDEAAGALASAGICWVPSVADQGRDEALKAMALGRAVVASDVPCLRELIRDGVTGCLVPPGDAVALARRTRALLRDGSLCQQLGQAARADIVDRCAPARVAPRWHALYNDLAA
jgi:glycosyltransferase involved in cell wall biosynthesis